MMQDLMHVDTIMLLSHAMICIGAQIAQLSFPAVVQAQGLGLHLTFYHDKVHPASPGGNPGIRQRQSP